MKKKIFSLFMFGLLICILGIGKIKAASIIGDNKLVIDEDKTYQIKRFSFDGKSII